MFPIYNNGDLQFKIFAEIKINQQNKRGSTMNNTIVKNLECHEYELYNKLDEQTKYLFEFAVKHSDRVLYFESITELRNYLTPGVAIELKNRIEITLKQFGFCYQKMQLSEALPAQKILFIYEGFKNGNK